MAALWSDKSQSFALYDLFLFCFKFNVMCIQFQDVNYESMITMLCVVYTLFSFFHFVIFIFHTLFTTHWNSFYHVEKEEFLTLSLFLWLLFPRLVCILLPLCFFFPPIRNKKIFVLAIILFSYAQVQRHFCVNLQTWIHMLVQMASLKGISVMHLKDTGGNVFAHLMVLSS